MSGQMFKSTATFWVPDTVQVKEALTSRVELNLMVTSHWRKFPITNRGKKLLKITFKILTEFCAKQVWTVGGEDRKNIP